MKDDDIVWDDDGIVWDEPKKSRAYTQELARQAGLAARYGVGGLAKAAGIFVDPFQSLAGGQTFSGAVSNMMDRAGVPKPESAAEHIAGAGSEAIAGGTLFFKAAAMAPKALQQAVPYLRSLMAAPTADMAATGAGGLASETVRQAGGPDWAAMIAGGAAPMGVSAATAVPGAIRGGREILRPVTKAGQKQIAADVVGRLAQDKTASVQNLGQYNALKALEEKAGKPLVGVPGSKPTSGAVSADYGLIGAQQLIERGDAGPMFSTQRGVDNAARLDELAKLRATGDQLAAYVTRRDAVTKPLREQTFANATGPVDYGRVEGLINALRNSPAGGKQETGRALDVLKQWVAKRKDEGRVTAEDAYALHQDINDLIRGKVNDDKGAVRLAAGMATSIKQELADVIEEVAPGFRKYLTTYARLSRPIERLETIVEKLGDGSLSKVTNALPMVGPGGPQFALSQSKMRTQVGAIEKEAKPPLAPYQRDVLGRVMGDLNSAELAARGGKPPGSDTYQNIAGANFVNRILGQEVAESGTGRTLQRPLNFLYKPFESGINDLIVEAFQDPKKMEELLRLARKSRQSPTLAGLLGGGVSRSTEGLLGSILAQ